MKKYNKTVALDELILLLQEKQAIELKLLKDQFHITYESLRPVNLIKNTIHEVTTSEEIKEDLLKNAIGLATGYLSKKVVVGESDNPFRKLLGLFLQFAVATFVSKHAESIKAAGDNILRFVSDYINGFSQEEVIEEEPE